MYPRDSPLARFICQHGDTVQDISFEVDDCEYIYKRAIERGAISISPPQEYRDEHGYVVIATILGFGDVVHSLVERVEVYNA